MFIESCGLVCHAPVTLCWHKEQPESALGLWSQAGMVLGVPDAENLKILP
ncbi:hypothetical protein L911_1666 [Vibrio fluvialis I21563]|nr:hypothetical protein L911_1666 [Vibrio fluvialis I21563]